MHQFMQLIVVPRVWNPWISASAFTLFRIYPTFFAYILFAQSTAAFSSVALDYCIHTIVLLPLPFTQPLLQ